MELTLIPEAGTRFVHAALPGTVTCTGQSLAVAPGRYDWLWLRVSSSAELTVTVWLYYAGGLDPEPLVVPAGEDEPVRLPVTRRDDLQALRLPDEPRLRLHAVTLVRPAGSPHSEPRPGSEKEVASA